MGCVGSTELGLDPAQPYELHPDVALRPEPFGALAYHYGNRRLTFLRSAELVELVRVLGSHESVEASMDAVGLSQDRLPAICRALASLEAGGVVRRRGDASAA